MQIVLSNGDLVAAVTNFLGSVVTFNETATVSVEITEDGAIVEVTPAGQEPAPPVKRTRGKRTASVTDGKLSVQEQPIVVEKLAEVVEQATKTVAPTDPSPGVITGGASNPLPGDPGLVEEEQQEEDPVQEPVPEQKPVNKATSLFANLNRPKN